MMIMLTSQAPGLAVVNNPPPESAHDETDRHEGQFAYSHYGNEKRRLEQPAE